MPPNGGLKLGIAGAIQACIRLYKDQKRTAIGGQALSIALACAFTCTEVEVEHCRGNLTHHNVCRRHVGLQLVKETTHDMVLRQSHLEFIGGA